MTNVKQPRVTTHARKRRAGPLLNTITEEENDEPKQGKTCCRCNPKDVTDAIKIMSEPQKDRIRALAWGQILDITIEAVKSRILYTWLLSKIDAISMELRVPGHSPLPINKHVVHTVMAVPPGTKPPPKHSSADVSAEKSRLAQELGCEDGNITINRLKDKLREHKTDDLSIRCFFLILFNRLLFSTTTFNICNTEVEYKMNFSDFGEVDWQQAMIDDIRRATNHWNSMGPKSTNPSVNSCLPFVIIYYLDNLEHNLNDNNRMTTPRAALFTGDKISAIMRADKWKDANGRPSYGKLHQKSRIGSTYDTLLPAAQPGSSSNFASPRISGLLHGVKVKVSDRKKDQFTELVAALDTDICRNQERGFHELQRVTRECVSKFANDLQALLASPSRSQDDSDTEDPIAGEAENHESGCHSIDVDIHMPAQYLSETEGPLPTDNILPEVAPSEHQDHIVDDMLVGDRQIPSSESNPHPTQAGAHDPAPLPRPTFEHSTPPDVEQQQNITDARDEQLNATSTTHVGVVAEGIEYSIRGGGQQHTQPFASPPVPAAHSTEQTSHTSVPIVDKDGQQATFKRAGGLFDFSFFHANGEFDFPSTQELSKNDVPRSSDHALAPPDQNTGSSNTHNENVAAHTTLNPGVLQLEPAGRPMETCVGASSTRRPAAEDEDQLIQRLSTSNQYNEVVRQEDADKQEAKGASALADALDQLIERIAVNDTFNEVILQEDANELQRVTAPSDTPFMVPGADVQEVTPTQEYDGALIKDCFANGGYTDMTIMDDCVTCLAYHDQVLRPECYGYRIFLGPRISMLLHPEGHNLGESNAEFNMDNLIHLVMYHREHFSLYCINKEQSHIHVLDSLDYKSLNTRFKDHHDPKTMYMILDRLNQALQIISKRDFPNFVKWRRTQFKPIPIMKKMNDCATFIMHYLEGFEGQQLVMHPKFQPENTDVTRSEMLHYMLFHALNLIKKFHLDIQRFR